MFALLRKYKSFLILLTVLIIVLFAYKFITVNNGSGPLLTRSVPNQLEGSVVGREIVQQLAELQAISFGKDLFINPDFLSLVNFVKAIREESPGRNNPFAPIGSGGIYTPKIDDNTPTSFTEDFDALEEGLEDFTDEFDEDFFDEGELF